MRLAVYSEDGRELLGTLEPYGDGLWAEPFDGNLRYGPEANLAELKWSVASRFGPGHASAEDFLRQLLRDMPGRVQAVPDGTPIEDIWPGAANDPYGCWLRYHPNCPNPPGRKDRPRA
jgi:hypothetical protein